MSGPRLGFFTRLLDDAPAAVRYRNAIDQFVHAEALGFDTAWVSHGTSWPSELPAPTLEATATVSVLDDLIARERRRTPPIG